MKILFVGEIVARPGRTAISKVLPEVLKTENPDFVISNAENLAHGRGATEGTIKEMQAVGINFFTGGDHLFWHKGFDSDINNLPVIRPINIKGEYPGVGYKVVETPKGKILIMNAMSIQSHLFEEGSLDNPYLAIEQVLNENKDVDFSILDFHSEYSSDKHAMGFFLDGRITAVVGSHTHVPTCDNRILPNGTMYLTDIGMCGNIDSVLGVKKEIIIDRVVYSKKEKFEWEEKGTIAFRSVVIDTDTREIRRLDKVVS